jgi:putative membrane protein
MTARRRPAAFSLGEVRYEPDELYPEPDADKTGEPAAVIRKPRSGHWVGLFLSAAAGLIALAAGLAVDNLIRDLFARTDWLGWLAVALTALAAIALAVLALREIAGLVRLRRITHIQLHAADAVSTDDRREALKVVGELEALYRRRPETARGRAALGRQRREIIDGRDLIALAETELVLPFDEAARRLVTGSAQRVALVTAISPRAIVDLIFVGAQILRLIRRIATLYGGRPGTIGFFRLAREVIAHLAVTGGIAAGDSLVQQILGHGLAARLSARLGEGVVNGLLTARVGIAAIEVCRPLPFVNGRPPRLADVMVELRQLGLGDGKAKDERPKGD